MRDQDEIITLQFGSYANFIGVHYYSIQEAGFSFSPHFLPDILPDRLFRSSSDGSGNLLSFTPRAVLVDDEFKSTYIEELQKNDLEETSVIIPHEYKNAPQCSKTKNTAQAKENEKVLFKSRQIEENNQNWTDFLSISFHPRSYILAPKEYGLSCPESTYYVGSSKANNDFWNNYEESIRFFAEECDTLQGFQIISEGHTPYSGVASNALNFLKDEYLKKVRLVTPVYYFPETASHYEKQVYLCNSASFLADANDNADVITPLSVHKDPWKLLPCMEEPSTNLTFRNLRYNGFNMYESSAILAATYEYMTLPYRKRDETNISMSDYSQINIIGRTISNPGIVMPFTQTKTDSVQSILKNWNGPFFQSISPFASFDSNLSADIMYIFSKGVLRKQRFDATRNMMVEENIESLEKNLIAFIQTLYTAGFIKNFYSSANFRIPSTYPNIFDNNFNLTNEELKDFVGRIGEFNGLSCLINSKDTKNKLESLSSKALINYKKLCITTDEILETDYANSVCERLMCLANNYSDNYEL